MIRFIPLFLFPFFLTAEFQLYPPPLTATPKKVSSYWIYTINQYLERNEETFCNVEKSIDNIPFDCGYCLGFIDAMKIMDECLNYQNNYYSIK